jgi:hypothetical protein
MKNLKSFASLVFATLLISIFSNVNLKGSNYSLGLLSQIEVGQPAQAAGWEEGVKFIGDNWDSIVSYGWSAWNTQVYMTELSGSEIQSIRNQYRSRADGVLFDRALERSISTYRLSGWKANVERTFMRPAYAGRIENGKYNLYRRMPNNMAQQFKQKRGW